MFLRERDGEKSTAERRSEDGELKLATARRTPADTIMPETAAHSGTAVGRFLKTSPTSIETHQPWNSPITPPMAVSTTASVTSGLGHHGRVTAAARSCSHPCMQRGPTWVDLLSGKAGS